MPYAIAYDPETSTFVVADTFKHRLATYTADGSLVSSIAYHNQFLAGDFEPFGQFYSIVTDTVNAFQLDLPGINKNVYWLVSYNRCINFGGEDLIVYNPHSLSLDLLYYCLFHSTVHVDGEEFHILGSSQNSFIVINSRGWFKCFHDTVWKSGDQFYDNFGNPIQFAEYVKKAQPLFDKQAEHHAVTLQDKLSLQKDNSLSI